MMFTIMYIHAPVKSLIIIGSMGSIRPNIIATTAKTIGSLSI